MNAMVGSALNQVRKISENDYGHDEQEWGLKDDSEKLEWEEYYASRSRKWANQSEFYEDLSPSGSEKNFNV